ncbi:MAG: LamG-like jellyroll fold domain-containing protein [Cytophagaceae bacterium]
MNIILRLYKETFLLFCFLIFISQLAFGQTPWIDKSFQYLPGANGDIFSIAKQSDGKFIIGGNFTSFNGAPFNRLVRLNQDGTIDYSFDIGSGFNDVVKDVKILPDNRIIVGGQFTSTDGFSRSGLAILSSTGTLDNFNPLLGLTNPKVNTIALAGSSIIIGGLFDQVNGQPRNNLAKLLLDGSLDVSFNSGSGGNRGTTGEIMKVLVDDIGNVVLGGNFTAIFGTSRSNFVRLTSGGTIDPTFPNVNFNFQVRDIEDIPGKYLVGGSFSSPASRFAVVDKSNGSILPLVSAPDAGVNSIKVLPNGKILIGGDFDNYGSTLRARLARLNSDYSLDMDFLPGGLNNLVEDFETMNDGRIIAVGSMVNFMGESISRIIRVFPGMIYPGTMPPPGSYCTNQNLNINYNAPGCTFNAGNEFKVELSNSLGLFTNPATIGQISSTATSGSIPVLLPDTLAGGPNYRLRIVSTNQLIVGEVTSAFTINKAPIQPGTITGPTSYCEGTNNMYTIASVTGATTYSWSLTGAGTILTGNGTTSVNTNLNGATQICVSSGNTCGNSALMCKTLSPMPTPAQPGPITGPSEFCSGQTGVNYSVPAGAPTYMWSVPTGSSILSGNGTNLITVNMGPASGNVCVYAQSAGCVSPQECLPVTVSTLSSTLIVNFPFSGNFNDVSGNNLNGSNTGASFVPDRTGQSNRALLFNGSASVTSSNSGLYGSNITVAAWVMPSGLAANNPIVSKHSNPSGFELALDNTGRVVFRGGSGFITSFSSITPSAWNFIAASVSGGNVKIYINGQLDATGTVGGAITSSFPLTIGKSASLTQFFNGLIDDVKVFGTTLTDAQVASLYPRVTIATSNTTRCIGDNVTFTSSLQNVTGTPLYQWRINGTAVSGATAATFTSSTINNNDIVDLVITGNGGFCGEPSYAISNPVAMTMTICSNCNASTPKFNVDLSAGIYDAWDSPSISRNSTCCASAGNCINFIVTLHPGAKGIILEIVSGTMPVGVNVYESACGAAVPIGTPLCLNGPGPHSITYCKPGTNPNVYRITSFKIPDPAPVSGPSAVCENQSGVTFSVPPVSGAIGYIWSLPPGVVISGANDGNSISVDFTSATSGNICVKARSSCDTSNLICKSVFVDQVPSTSVAGPDSTFTADNLNLYANFPTTGTGTWSVLSGPAGLNIANVNSATSYTDNIDFGTYQLQWTISNGICPPSSSTINLTRVTSLVKTFTGSGSWYDAARWAPSLPSTGDDVEINGHCEIPGGTNIEVNNLTINSSGSLVIGSSANLVFTTNGTVAGDGVLSMMNSAEWKITGSNNFVGTFNSGTGTVTYDGTSSQSVVAGNYNFLKINSPNAVLDGNIFVKGLEIADGASFDCNSGNYIVSFIEGDFVVNGAFIPGNSTFIFDGTATQEIKGTPSAALFYNIQINGAVKLSKPISVSANTVIGGKLDIGTISFPSLGTVSGSGVLSISAQHGGTANFPFGNFTSFVSSAGSVVEYYGAGDFEVASSGITYPNLKLTGSGYRYMMNPVMVAGDLLVQPVGDPLEIEFQMTVSVGGSTINSGITYFTDETFLDGTITTTSGASTKFYSLLEVTNGQIDGNGEFIGELNSLLRILGPGATVIQGNPVILDNLFLNNVYLNLFSNVEVSGEVDLNYNSQLALRDSDLLLNSTANTINYGTSAYINTADGTGSLVIKGSASSEFIDEYPLGYGTAFTPFNLLSLSGSPAANSTLSLKVFEFTTAPAGAYGKRYISINSTGLDPVSDFSFNFNSQEVIGAPLTVFKDNTLVSNPFVAGNTYGVNPGSGISSLNGEWKLLSTEKTFIATSGNWHEGSNWSPVGVPEPTDDVIINGTCIVGDNASANNILVNGQLQVGTASDAVRFISLGDVTGPGALSIVNESVWEVRGKNEITSFGPGGTVEYAGTDVQQVRPGDYHTIVFNSYEANLIGDITVTAGLIVNSGKVLEGNTYTIDMSGGDMILNGVTSLQDATLVFSGSGEQTILGSLTNIQVRTLEVRGALKAVTAIDAYETIIQPAGRLDLGSKLHALGTVTGTGTIALTVGEPETNPILPDGSFFAFLPSDGTGGTFEFYGDISFTIPKLGPSFRFFNNVLLTGEGVKFNEIGDDMIIHGALINRSVFEVQNNLWVQKDLINEREIIIKEGIVTEIEGELTNAVTGVFNAELNSVVAFRGDIVNLGAFNISNSNFIAESGGTKTISGNPINFHKLDLKNTHISLQTNIRVDYQIEFINNDPAQLFLNNSNLTLGKNVVFVDFNDVKYVDMSGNGYIIKEGNSALNFQGVYPLGFMSAYTPFNLTSLDATFHDNPELHIKVNNMASAPRPGDFYSKSITLSSVDMTVNDFGFNFSFPAEASAESMKLYRYFEEQLLPAVNSNVAVNSFTVTPGEGNTNFNGEWMVLQLEDLAITYFDPSVACLGDSIDIYGSGFNSGAAIQKVYFGLIATTEFSVKADDQIRVKVPMTATSGNITVENEDLVTAVSEGELTISSPAAPDVTNAQGCESSSVTLIASHTGSSSFLWYDSPAGGNMVHNTAETNVSEYTFSLGTESITYYVEYNDGYCSSERVSVTATVLIAPTASISSSVNEVCPGGSADITFTFTGTAPWSFSYLDAEEIPASSSSNEYILPVTPSSTTTYILVSVSDVTGCPGVITTNEVTISVGSAPIASAGADITVCANNNVVNLSGTVQFSAGAQWSTNGTGTFDDASAMNAVYNPSAADNSNGVIILTLTTAGNTGCIEASDDITVNITPSPTVNAGADIEICESGTASLSGTVTVAIGGTWTSTGNGTFNNAGALNAIYTPGTTDINDGSVTLTLTSTGNGSCNAVTDQILININAAPIVNAGSDFDVCSNDIAALSATLSGATNVQWSGSGTGTFDNDTGLSTNYTPSNADISSGSVTLTIQTTDNSLCDPAVDEVTITFVAAPAAHAGTVYNTCGITAVPVNGTVTNSSGQNWTSNGTGNYSDASATSTTYTPSAEDVTSGTLTLTLTANGNGVCSPVTSTATLVISPGPQAEISGNESVCEGNSAFLNISFTGTAPWDYEFTDGVNTFSGSTLVSPFSPEVTPAANSTYNMVSVFSGSCQGTVSGSATVNILANPAANLVIHPLEDTVCVNRNPVLTLMASQPSVDYRIFVNGNQVGGLRNGDGNDMNLGLTNIDFADGYNQVTVVAEGCSPVELDMKPVVRKSSMIKPVVTSTNTDLCNNAEVRLQTTNPAEALAIRWLLNNSLLAGEQAIEHVAHAAGEYRSVAINNLCRLVSEPITISRGPALPQISVSNNSTSTELSIPSGYSRYQWYAGQKAIYQAVGENYIAYYNSAYSVAVNYNNCRLVSDPVVVNNASLEELLKKNFISNDSMIFILPPFAQDEPAVLYPNPATDAFTIKYVSATGVEVVFDVYDVMGNKVLSQTIASSPGMIQQDFNNLKLNSGLYYVYIQEGEKRTVETVMIR